MGGSGAGGSSSGGSGARGGGTAAPGAAAAPGRRGGMSLDFRRGRTSKRLLEIAWTHPVYKPPEARPAEAGGTAATPVEAALPLEQALALVTEGDRRPLLVLRECELCKGTDHALLNRSLDNEQTILLTGWFRCIKLPPNVLEEKHPLHALFQPAKEGEPIPHLFFAQFDGSQRTPLPGDQTQAQLWEVMFGFLDDAYAGDAKKAVKELRSLLSSFDTVDAMEQEVKAKIDRELEKRGPDSPRLEKLQQDLQELQQKRQELEAREKALRALARKELAAPEKPANAGG